MVRSICSIFGRDTRTGVEPHCFMLQIPGWQLIPFFHSCCKALWILVPSVPHSFAHIDAPFFPSLRNATVCDLQSPGDSEEDPQEDSEDEAAVLIPQALGGGRLRRRLQPPQHYRSLHQVMLVLSGSCFRSGDCLLLTGVACLLSCSLWRVSFLAPSSPWICILMSAK